MKNYRFFLFIFLVVICGLVSVGLFNAGGVYADGGVQVQVGPMADETFKTYTVFLTDTVGSVKTQMETDGYVKARITLSFNDEVLEDNQTLAYYGISHGDTLGFEYREWNILLDNIVAVRWISISIALFSVGVIAYTYIAEARLKKKANLIK